MIYQNIDNNKKCIYEHKVDLNKKMWRKKSKNFMKADFFSLVPK